MSKDAEGRRRTSTFDSHDTEIYMTIEWVAGREDAILTLDLFPPEGALTWLSEVDIAPGKGYQDIRVQLLTKVVTEDGKEVASTTGPWPKGPYEVDLRIDGEYEQTVKFEVV